MSQMNQNNTNSDHTDTKIFVGGLTWRTTSDDLRNFFRQFGEILYTNVVYYPEGRSKGYGFVIFKDAETATKVCENKNYVIDGRTANVNIASLGAKNNNNNQSSNQNGSLHQTRISHQYQNGSLNPARSFHQYQPIPHPYFSPIPFYCDPGYGQYYPHMHMYNSQNHHYPTPMVNNYYSPIHMMQHNSNRPPVISMPRNQPVVISAPRKSSRQLETIEETNQGAVNVVFYENNEETITITPENDQEGESIGQDKERGDIAHEENNETVVN